MNIDQDLERQLHEKLQSYFGYKQFRAQQLDIIKSILTGQDTIVLMPTGGGKSICFQIPSVVLDGLTLVISPLIALMKDQVQRLNEVGIQAAYLNSTLTMPERRILHQQLEDNQIKLLYVSPEKLLSQNFISYLKTLRLKLIAVDEAHCISSWGHHFRPEYKKLNILKKHFPEIPIIALTATADKAVRSDIGELLSMENPKTFLASFDRPNLSLSVLPGQKRWEQILQILRRYQDKSGIIYCGSRKATENIAQKLCAVGFKAACYHAKLPIAQKNKAQDDFLQGDIDIICATVAFGMGIDKPDIRFVIHYNMPGTLENYYQEIGRAGRDGKKADTILFYSYSDVMLHQRMLGDIKDVKYLEIQEAKLKRMQEFAEALVCRRKILLSYFSETLEEDCGNCDVCRNPPDFFDGTIIAQKALSAIARAKQQTALSALVDILKGNFSKAVTSKGFQSIKTFGAGKDLTAFAWQLYIQQFIQQGLIEIDYKDNYTLKLNELSKKVLLGDKTINLVRFEVIKNRQAAQKQLAKKVKAPVTANQKLFDHLKRVRLAVADNKRKPVFTIFSDASLRDMVELKPKNHLDFLEVHGVGEHKAAQYAKTFIHAIQEFEESNQKGKTHEQSWKLYQQGKTIPEIAQIRSIQETTVWSHLTHSMRVVSNFDIYKLVSTAEIAQVRSCKERLGDEKKLKPFYHALDGQISYGKLRMILEYINVNP